ncbi:MAG TPA: hypothetical protein VI911_08920 [Patescibacteria group bacterium]|nr:MAG: Recombination endonuclease VII subfamily [candidate division TM6 bacterium GW2011_GWF2_33_332]HLD91119.1 hypothetical protein [Patescibacteria group bacterium]
MTTKFCPKCKQEKNIEDFCIDRAKKSGRSSYCRKCKIDRIRETKDNVNSRRRKYYRKNKDRICELGRINAKKILL